MRGLSRIYTVVGFVLIIAISPCLFAEVNAPKEESKYLKAVREFADNVLKHGRDTYGPKHTPLFVDGLNIHTHEPVKWIAPNGDRWILSNLASQQNLFRVLDGLTTITGDPKYKQAAMEAIEYAFENLRSPNGLLYWGAYAAYDAFGDRPCGGGQHVFKAFYPYYELMWQVDPEATRQVIESFWASHILDWSNLEMDRIGPLDRLSVPKGWEHEYKGGPVFFKSWKRPFASTGSDLYYAAAILCKLSGQKEPLIWGKRLANRYVETRDSRTGISTYVYTLYENASKHPLAEDFKGQVVESFLLFPPGIEQMLDPMVWKCKLGYFIVSPDIPYSYVSNPWICCLLVGELLGIEGREFTQWALEELTARGKVAYRKKDNVWIPMLPDGTSLEGYAYKEAGLYGPKGTTFRPISAVPMDFWGYALAYRLTNDQFIWRMAHNIARGAGLGNIGITPANEPKLKIPIDHFDPYTLLALLELYKKTEKSEFLRAAQKVGDNILAVRFHKGFFAPSNKHIYAKFDAIEALALLHLNVAKQDKGLLVPQVLPGRPLFNFPFRDKEIVVDNSLIYTLTESPDPPRSLQEAAACGDVELVKNLIAQGVDVNSKEGLSLDMALHRAAGAGHKEIVELLINGGADIEARKGSSTPLDIAIDKKHKEIAQLLVDKGAMLSSIHVAAQMGDQRQIKAFLDQGIDVDLKDKDGSTPLLYAVRGNHKDLVKLLIAKGADINIKDKWNLTLLHHAIFGKNVDILELLLGGDADVAFTPEKGYPVLDLAVSMGDINIARILVDHGAKFDARNQDGWTALRRVVSQGNQDMLELFVAKGADTSTFFMAACTGDLERVKSFVEKGADINTKDELGWTPLYWAASLGQTEVAKLLIDKGADVRTVATDGGIVLYQAVQSGANELVELLLLKGADVQAKAKRGDTSLHRAAGSGYREIAELLIAKGAEIDAKDMGGGTPLHRAAFEGHKDVVEILITNGADVTVKDRRGRTPLDWAKLRKHVEIAEMLTKAAQKQKTSGDKSFDVSPDMAAMQVACSTSLAVPLGYTSRGRSQQRTTDSQSVAHIRRQHPFLSF